MSTGLSEKGASGQCLTVHAKADSHASHPGRAREITEYYAESQMRWMLSAPYYHQGVGEVEVTFGIDVSHPAMLSCVELLLTMA